MRQRDLFELFILDHQYQNYGFGHELLLVSTIKCQANQTSIEIEASFKNLGELAAVFKGIQNL